MYIPQLLRRPLAFLDRYLGRAVYRDTIQCADWQSMGHHLERALRERYEQLGYQFRIQSQFKCLFINAYRGLTSGFGVGLVVKPDPPGDTAVLLGIGRTSRLDAWSIWPVTAFGLVGFLLSIALAGWLQLPNPMNVIFVVALSLAALLGSYQLLLLAISAAEALGGGRLSRAEIQEVVDLVRDQVEAFNSAREQQPPESAQEKPDTSMG